MADLANSGIYEIVNLVNGKRYIGSAKSLLKRRREHWTRLKGGWHNNRKLQNSWNKYGSENFQFRVLIICSPPDLLLYEQRAIDGFSPELNICPTAGSTLGRPHTDEAKAKIGDRLRGSTRDPEVVESIAAQLRGRKKPPEHSVHLVGNKHAKGYRHTDEWKSANSVLHTGRSRPKSPEYRAKIAATLREKSQSPEARDRLRQQAALAWQSRSQEDRNAHMEKVRAARGPITEDQRRQISERQIGRPMHPNAVAALAAANKGRKFSDEHKRKMSEGIRKSWTLERKIKHSAAISAAAARKRAMLPE